jgi:hypothetical protein
MYLSAALFVIAGSGDGREAMTPQDAFWAGKITSVL